MTFDEIVVKTLRDKHFEPEPSTRDRSVREMSLGPHHIWHRFTFPGAIPLSRILAANIKQNNALLERLRPPEIAWYWRWLNFLRRSS